MLHYIEDPMEPQYQLSNAIDDELQHRGLTREAFRGMNEQNPQIHQFLQDCRYRIGKHMLDGMILTQPQNREGIWFCTARGWECLKEVWDRADRQNEPSPFCLETRTELTQYQGILGYVGGWRIQLGMAPQEIRYQMETLPVGQIHVFYKEEEDWNVVCQILADLKQKQFRLLGPDNGNLGVMRIA